MTHMYVHLCVRVTKCETLALAETGDTCHTHLTEWCLTQLRIFSFAYDKLFELALLIDFFKLTTYRI